MIFSRSDILNALPHRFENQLLDKVTLLERNETTITGSFDCFFEDPSPEGHDIFYRKKGEITTLLNPVYMEILALAAIVCITSKPGYLFIFAGISNFESHSDYVVGTPLRGKVTKTGQKADLYVCNGEIKNAQDDVVVSGTLNAVQVPESDLGAKPPVEGFVPPETLVSILHSKERTVKRSSMVVCDACIQVDSATLDSVFTYTYPMDHPLTRGHFPNNPIMMGVMQMMGVEDCVLCLAEHSMGSSKKTFVVEGNASIIKQDGNSVAAFKQFKINVVLEGDTKDHYSEFVALKKVVFKGMVVPGDTLYFYLSNITVS